jgi:hypothetical protein
VLIVSAVPDRGRCASLLHSETVNIVVQWIVLLLYADVAYTLGEIFLL